MANFYLLLDEENKILRIVMREIILRIKNNVLRMAAENGKNRDALRHC